jgi:hypothetical protein
MSGRARLILGALAILLFAGAAWLFLLVRRTTIPDEISLQLSARGMDRDYIFLCEATRRHAASAGELSARQRAWAGEIEGRSNAKATRRILAALAYADPGERYDLLKAGGNVGEQYGLAKAAGIEPNGVPSTWECPEMREWLAGVPTELLKEAFPQVTD